MGFNVPPAPTGGDFEVPEDDTHPARIVGVWDVGYQSKTFADETKVVQQACVCYQVDGKQGPIYLYEALTVPSFWPSTRSNLWQLAETALGTEAAEKMHDFWELVGSGLMIETRRNSKGNRAYVKRFMRLPKQLTAPEAAREFIPSKREGLAAYLWEHRVDPDEVRSFSAPTPGADDTTPDDTDCPF